jgi:hypothetical protein
LESSIAAMKFQSWEVLVKVVSDEVNDAQIIDKLRRRFESHFRYDEKGLPRVWSLKDDIDGIYSKSKNETDQLLLLLSDIKIDLENIDGDILSNEVRKVLM